MHVALEPLHLVDVMIVEKHVCPRRVKARIDLPLPLVAERGKQLSFGRVLLRLSLFGAGSMQCTKSAYCAGGCQEVSSCGGHGVMSVFDSVRRSGKGV